MRFRPREERPRRRLARRENRPRRLPARRSARRNPDLFWDREERPAISRRRVARRGPARRRKLEGLLEHVAFTPMRGELKEQLEILQENAEKLLEAIEATLTFLPERGRLNPMKLKEIASNIEYMKDFMTDGRRAMRTIIEMASELAGHAEEVEPGRGWGEKGPPKRRRRR